MWQERTIRKNRVPVRRKMDRIFFTFCKSNNEAVFFWMTPEQRGLAVLRVWTVGTLRYHRLLWSPSGRECPGSPSLPHRRPAWCYRWDHAFSFDQTSDVWQSQVNLLPPKVVFIMTHLRDLAQGLGPHTLSSCHHLLYSVQKTADTKIKSFFVSSRQNPQPGGQGKKELVPCLQKIRTVSRTF